MVKNMVSSKNACKPNYRLDPESTFIYVYIRYDGKVLVVQRYDTNYICSLFFSTISNEKELNEIFDYCVRDQSTFVISAYNIPNDCEKMIEEAYSIEIRKVNADSSLSGIIFDPQKTYYCIKEYENFAFESKSFACEVRRVWRFINEKAKITLAHNDCEKAYKEYLEILTQPINEFGTNYNQCLPLIEIIYGQKYMSICKDAKIRKLYIRMCKRIIDMYNVCMTVQK